MFHEAILFAFEKTFFKVSEQNFVIPLHGIIGLQNLSLIFCKSQSKITMCNLHWSYTFYTGVTLELHCNQPIRIE